jgi:hypothetical protein
LQTARKSVTGTSTFRIAPSPSSTAGVRGPEETNRVYLFNCPFEEKDDAKRAGAKWDGDERRWYVSSSHSQRLECFNRWHPNGRIYLECSYDQKDDAKSAGARWDVPMKQWYINLNQYNDSRSKFARWLPSSSSSSSSSSLPSKSKEKKTPQKTKLPLPLPSSTSKENKTPKKTKRSNSQLATIPRINEDMTVTQLQNECRRRDPSIMGISNKNKDWLLDHLKVGSPWIPAASNDDEGPRKKQTPIKKIAKKKNVYRINEDMTIVQLQTECRARDPSIKGISNKNKDWLQDHLVIGSVWKSATSNDDGPPQKKTAPVVAKKKVSKINEDMTITQLQTECRSRDPSIKGISNKNKDWLLDHLNIGSVWKSVTSNDDDCPQKKVAPVIAKKKNVYRINEDMTIVQLQTECRARDPSIKGISNKNKDWLLDHLVISSVWKSVTSNDDDHPPKPTPAKGNPVSSTDAISKPKSDQGNKKKVHIVPKGGNGDAIKKKSESSSKKSSTESKKRSADAITESTENKISTKKVKKETASTQKTVSKQATEKNSRSPNKMAIKKDPDGEKLSTKKVKKESTSIKTEPEPSIKKTTDKKTPKAGNTTSTSQTRKPAPKTATSDSVKASTPHSNVIPYTKISSKMTMATLRKEAFARQMGKAPKLKSDLLRVLVEGSICVHESTEYRAYQNLLNKIQTERAALCKASLEKEKALKARRDELQLKREAKEERERAAEQQQKEKQRREEITQQKVLHAYSFPRVHLHDLAQSNELMNCGTIRSESVSCDCRHCGYYGSTPIYSCEICDWDICETCFKHENKSQAEKEHIRIEHLRKREEDDRREEEEERKETEEHERKWNAKKRFRPSIIKPEGKHLDPNSRMWEKYPNSGLKYTVWCSDGYDADGWHSYEGSPTKEFDSVWITKKEANDRAEYLFFWKNPWGHEPEELEGDYTGEIVPEYVDGLVSRSVAPPDSTRWTTGVVPANAFSHLPNSTTDRHNFDDDDEGKEEEYCGRTLDDWRNNIGGV